MTFAEWSQRLGRADFLDGVGIYVERNQVALAHVVKRFFQVRLRHTVVRPLPGPDHPAERRQALAEAVAAFTREHRVDAVRTSLCLPRALAAVNRVLLPAAAKENLAQVLEYEIDHLLPLARDKVNLDWSVREIGGERLEVLLTALPSDVVRAHLEALEDAFVRPRSIVLASTALADLVAFCRGDGERPMGLVLEGAGGTEVAVVKGGRLVASQLLPSGCAGQPAAVGRALTRVVSDAGLAGEELPFYHWPAANGAAAPGAADDDLMALARGRLEAPPEFFATAEPALLPAVGAALGAVREGTVAINLLPEEGRRLGDQGLSLATVVLTAVVVLLAVVWGASALVKDAMLRRQVTEQLAQIDPQVREVRAIEDQIESMQKQIDILTGNQDERVIVLLKEVTDLVPADAYLTSLNLRNGRMTIDGQARSASELITALEKSKHFRNVSFTSPTTRVGDKERFTIVAEVAR
ncbi:MAG: PilN domain-containing protein [Candidatus Binatia bacterium]